MMAAERLKKIIGAEGINAEQIIFEAPVRTVDESAKALHAKYDDFVKSIVFYRDEMIIVAIVLGADRVDRAKVSAAMGITGLKLASPEETLEKTGYPAGGVPPFGFEAVFLIDSRVMQKDFVYSGGGSHNALLKISPNEIIRASKGRVADIAKG